jgi:translation initiation factor 5
MLKSGGQGGGNSPNNGDSGDNVKDNENDDFDDDFDAEDMTADAYTERLRELRGDVTNTGMYLNDTKESANMFYKLVKEKKEANQLLDAAVQKDLVKEAERLDIKDKSTLVLSELLFSENIIEEIKLYRMLFLRFCNENKKAQKYLLGGFEKLVGDVYKDKLFNNSLKILKQFYDEDIIEEEVIIEWSAKQSKKYVSKEMSKKIHEKVEPFVKWLKEAEVEDEDEEESEDDKQVKQTVKSNENKSNNHSSSNKKTDLGGENQRKSSLEDDENDDDLFEFSHRVSGIHIESVKTASVPKAVNADVAADAASNGHGEEDIDIDQI